MTARAEALEALRPLTGDGYVRITAVLLTAAAVPYVAPLLPAASMPGYSRWSDVPLLVVSILAFQAGLRSMGDPRLRRAWTLFSAALAAWLAARLVQVGWDTNAFQHAGHGLIEDVLYALFYLFFVLALESVPRQEGEQEPVASLRKLRSTGAAVFALGLLVYFVVLPGILNPTAYRTQVPSLLLFVTLDFYIVGRLVAHRLRSPRPPCSTAYTLLVVTAVLWALTDLAEVLEYLGWWSSAPGTAVELAWLPAWLTLVSAARAPYALPQHGDAARIPGASSAGPWPGTLMLFAVSVPVAHLAFTDVMDPISQPARRLWALLVTLVLAGLAVAYEVFLHRENARLVADRDAVARRLHGLQRVEAIGRLAGGIAHDFNNLLTIILSNAGLIDTALKGGRTNVQEDLDELTAAARRGTTLVKKLLGVGRRDLLVFRPVDVGEVVRGFFPALRRIVRPSIEMRLEVEEGLGPAR
ncbi:MAG TPA: hypothetical protein VD793_06215, partial [Gemmatimonadales bacterium]|nr:hypothetical protein [Gemmatimonadales bacterium]